MDDHTSEYSLKFLVERKYAGLHPSLPQNERSVPRELRNFRLSQMPNSAQKFETNLSEFPLDPGRLREARGFTISLYILPSTMLKGLPLRGSFTAVGCSARSVSGSSAYTCSVGAMPKAEPRGPPNSELVVMP
ncbi:MAG: hypothetical protein BWX93_01398 [Bacteroidetes bacterium ADurb.Bin139]|nr:MAG: hypothetical protein BWX93_01398 [Bacteroidetes bacterium ADurb.Bin139]